MSKINERKALPLGDDICATDSGAFKEDILLLHRSLGSVVPLLCGHEACTPGHNPGLTRRDYYLLHYVMEGRGTFRTGERHYELKKGQLFVIRPDEPVYYEADRMNPWYYIWIGFSVLPPLKSEDFILERQDVFTVPECRSIFREIANSRQRKASLELYLCGKIFELLAALTDSCVAFEPGASDYVDRAKDYIAANYAGDVTVQGIARCLGLSRSYFSAVFSRAEGISPQEYLVDYRLRKAAELIVSHNLRPGEAAAACGYPDVFTFSKMFKKKYGVSPGKYPDTGKG